VKIVVLGGTGNIGTALVRTLADRHDVTAGARRPELPGSELSSLANVATRDFAREPLDELLEGADAVVHLGWLFQPSHRPDETWRNNAVGAARVFEACSRARVARLVVSSSIAAYSPALDDEPVSEDYPTHGASAAAYCREKAYVERLLDRFELAEPDVRVCRIRPAFVFQRSSASQQRRLFAGPLVPGRLVRPSLIPALPVPRGLRLQAVHSDDVADAISACIEADAAGAFNLAAGDILGATELAELFDARPIEVSPGIVRGILASTWTARIVPAPPDLFDALMRLPVLSTARARHELGWSPRHSASGAVAEFLEGLRAGAGDATPPLHADSGPRERLDDLAGGVGQ
jgi:nucleoside-diphosphate-sugar epimerase